jgi:hypothetical protein
MYCENAVVDPRPSWSGQGWSGCVMRTWILDFGFFDTN